MKKTIMKTVITASVVAFTGCGVDGGGGGSSRNLDINLEKGVRLVKKTMQNPESGEIDTLTYEYDELNRLITMGGDTSYSYDGESLQESKIKSSSSSSKYIMNIEYSDTDKRFKRIKKISIREYAGSYPSTTTITYSDYKGFIAQKREENVTFGSSSIKRIDETAIIKVSNDKKMKSNEVTKNANENVTDEKNITFSYDKLNRRISQKTTSGSKENIYLTNYSENKKTAKPSCYVGTNEFKEYLFKKYPRRVRVCYLEKSVQIIIDNDLKQVITHEYKINDKNLVTEERLSTGVIITYEYEEY